MKILLGIILMVSGIIGVARGAINHAAVETANNTTLIQGKPYSLPLAPLAGAFLFVGGLMILAKRDAFSPEGPRRVSEDS